MRIPRIYYSAPLNIHKTLLLEEEAARHIGLVLRLVRKDQIILFNGDGFDYLAEILHIQTQKKAMPSIEVNILEKKTVNTRPQLHIHLFQAISKPEKLEWVIQKSVELGITEITPMITQYCAVKPSVIKLERLKKIILSACEQSGRADIPTLHTITTYTDLLEKPENNFPKNTNLLFIPNGKKSLNQIQSPHPTINIFIGPEGGFSEPEIQLAIQQNFHDIHLGKRILRTETAPLCAISAIQSLWGDFI